MSEAPSAPAPVSLEQMKGRLAELLVQRNAYQDRCAQLAGEKAEAVAVLLEAKAEIDRLTRLVRDAGLAPVAAPAQH